MSWKLIFSSNFTVERGIFVKNVGYIITSGGIGWEESGVRASHAVHGAFIPGRFVYPGLANHRLYSSYFFLFLLSRYFKIYIRCDADM